MEEDPKEETVIVAPAVDIVFKPLNLGQQFLQNGGLVDVPNALSKYKMLAVCFGASWVNQLLFSASSPRTS